MDRSETTSENFADRARCDLPCAAEARNSAAGVMIRANCDGESDFAPETRELALRLSAHPFPVQIVPVKAHDPQVAGFRTTATSKTLQRLTNDHLDLAESVLYQSGAPTGWNLDFYGRCRVGRAAFGTDRIPDGWIERCNDLDEIWVPTEFHRETFAVSGVERSKIRVIPRALDAEVFRPGRTPRRLPNVPLRSFQFLAVADGMLTSGIDILVRAFIEEFSPDEDVALALHCPPKRCGDTFIDFEAEVISLIETQLDKNLEDVPTIALVVGSLPEEDRAALFASSQGFVHPARADATGRHCLEALACQLPVIASDWGPLNDFLNDRNSFPLSTDVVAAQPDEDESVAGHRWAEPDLDHLRNQMREVFGAPREAALRAEQGRREAIAKFEWKAVLPAWIQNFQRLLD